MIDLAARVVPVLTFLVGISVTAGLADRVGVFALAAAVADRLAGGRVAVLWGLVALLATAATAVLSLDTAAVLLTPAVLALARRLRVSPWPFAFTTVWLANTGSLFLPVSNLTNLIAVSRMDLDTRGFVGLMVLPATSAVLVTVAVLAIVFRRDLAGRAEHERVPDPIGPGRRRARTACLVVVLAIVPCLAAGLSPTLVAGSAAVVELVGCLLLCPEVVSARLAPWPIIVVVAALFVVVRLAEQIGWLDWVPALLGAGASWPALARVAGIAAGTANVADNLPAYLLLEPGGGSAIRLAAVLIGVNVGPLISPWASVATMLWAGRCRAAGLRVDWRRFAGLGLLTAVAATTAAVSVLWLVSRAG